MRYIEVRRHTMRVKPGQNLSQAGVVLARRVGENMGPFNRVITSSIPRAFQTAIAMGFAVDEENSLLSVMADDVGKEIDWAAGFAKFAETARKKGATATYARKLAEDWHSIAESLPDGGSALLVTHGGIVEAGTVGCLPNIDHEALGSFIDYCEGVRLAHDGEKFVSAEILRVEK